mmetsp:Transcript_3298/g.4828  ORF Transcript_3298/g.4828 Transcript_3298/m.4828 type:complete len:201 (+) Transcript_3298:198-800(+)
MSRLQYSIKPFPCFKSTPDGNTQEENPTSQRAALLCHSIIDLSCRKAGHRRRRTRRNSSSPPSRTRCSTGTPHRARIRRKSPPKSPHRTASALQGHRLVCRGRGHFRRRWVDTRLHSSPPSRSIACHTGTSGCSPYCGSHRQRKKLSCRMDDDHKTRRRPRSSPHTCGTPRHRSTYRQAWHAWCNQRRRSLALLRTRVLN